MALAKLPWWKKLSRRKPNRRCLRRKSVLRPEVELLERRIVFTGDPLLPSTVLSFNSFQTAQHAGFLATANQVDLYKVQLNAGDEVNAAVSAQPGGSGLQSLLRVFRSD